MTPLFSWISGFKVNFGLLEPQKHAFFTDFGSDLWQNGGFRGSKYFLKVVIKLKDLQFTFTALVGPVGPLQDTGH
jgi:hypothetical protein